MHLEFGFEQTIATDDWPEMDQTVGRGADGWEWSPTRRTGAGRSLDRAVDGGVLQEQVVAGAQEVAQDGEKGGQHGYGIDRSRAQSRHNLLCSS
jgi:hypothetical protein